MPTARCPVLTGRGRLGATSPAPPIGPGVELVAKRTTDGVHHAALQPGDRDHGVASSRLAAVRWVADGHADVLERCPGEALREGLRPGHHHPDVGRPQRLDVDAGGLDDRDPGGVGIRPGASSRHRAPAPPHRPARPVRSLSRSATTTAVPRPAEPAWPSTSGSVTPGSFRSVVVGFAHPLQVWRTSIVTPSSSSRRNHDRSNGVARKPAGKTRPLDPTNVGSPNPSLQARSSLGPNPSTADAITGRAAPYRSSRSSTGSLWVRLSPPRPASSSLRPTDGMRSNTVTDGRPAPAPPPPSARPVPRRSPPPAAPGSAQEDRTSPEPRDLHLGRPPGGSRGFPQQTACPRWGTVPA